MEKMTLKLSEVLQLDKEINGSVNVETGKPEFEGFLKQDLSIILKYELTELGEFLSKEKKKVDSLRDELIKKYGTEDPEKGVLVQMFLEELGEDGETMVKKVNPNFIKLDEDFTKLMNQEIEVEYPEITKLDLKEAGRTKDNYQILFKLVKKEQ